MGTFVSAKKLFEMKALTQTSPIPFYKASTQSNVFTKFFNWCKAQERNRFGWLAISLTAHGCILTPLVVFAVGVSGNDFTLWMAAMLAMGVTLIVNLAAQPTKITIPIFFLSILVDVAIVIACIMQLAAY
jgi:hypothetical protein